MLPSTAEDGGRDRGAGHSDAAVLPAGRGAGPDSDTANGGEHDGDATSLLPRGSWAAKVFTTAHETLCARWRDASLQELSGSMGDLGTFLPLTLSLAAFEVIQFAPALFWAGFYNIATGVLWDSPIPVQPMKTIAAVALASGNREEPGLTPEEAIGAGLSVSAIILLLGATGMVDIVNRLVPRPVVHGLQMGLGLSMMVSATNLVAGLSLASEVDCVLLAVVSVLFVLGAPSSRVPTALLLSCLGLVIAFVKSFQGGQDVSVRPGFPPVWTAPLVSWEAVWSGFLKAGLAQLPLTTLNSVVSVCDLNNRRLFAEQPRKHISMRAMASSVGTMNLTGLWFGAMPMCHGAGGLAAQFRFGARTGSAVVMLGVIKVFVALLMTHNATALLSNFPTSVMAALLLFAGLGLASAGLSSLSPDSDDQEELSRRHNVALATAAVTVAHKTGWGFLAGMVFAAFNGGFQDVTAAIRARLANNYRARL